MMNRSIPACAGEPCSGEGRCRLRRVYPRVCGGTTPETDRAKYVGGLSPRVRGNHLLGLSRGQLQACQRSIPACAGEPLHVSGAWSLN